jgi:hypothetical protein
MKTTSKQQAMNTVINRTFWCYNQNGSAFSVKASVQLLTTGEAKIILHNNVKNVELVAVQGGQFGWKIAFCSSSNKKCEQIARTLLNQYYAC